MRRRFLVLPKAATKDQTSTAKDNKNGKVTATETRTNPDGFTDFVEVEEAKAEYNKRRKSQLGLIKKTDHELLRRMLYDMVLGRVFEEKSAEVYRMGKIGGFCHLYIGQEAIGVGSMTGARANGYVCNVLSRPRSGDGAAASRQRPLWPSFTAKPADVSKGKGGSMHMFSKEHEFYGGHGIVGGQIGVGTGMAYAAKYKGTGQVTMCFFGEAAVNQGIFHESLNMAQLWKLPMIYICENNVYGMGTSQKRAMSIASVAKKGDAYGIANEFVDGMDVMAVREAALRAIDRARNESLPTLLEIRAYRYMGHSMSDPGNYRTRDEIAKYQERDPIRLFQDSLEEAGVFNDGDFKQIHAEAVEAVDKALKFADESPLPDESELLTDVYA